MENHHFQWENSLFLWPFSIAMLNYQRFTQSVILHRIFLGLPTRLLQKKQHFLTENGDQCSPGATHLITSLVPICPHQTCFKKRTTNIQLSDPGPCSGL